MDGVLANTLKANLENAATQDAKLDALVCTAPLVCLDKTA